MPNYIVSNKDIEYTRRIEDQSTIHTVIWTIQDYLYLLEKKTMKEIRANKIDDLIEQKFQIKMQFLGRNDDIIELYYLYPTAVFLKAVQTICLRRFEERSLVIKDYHAIQSNKWQYLATVFNKDIIGQSGAGDTFILTDGSLRLKFQFYIVNNVKVGNSPVPAPQLSIDLKSLLNDGMFSDVTMNSCDGTGFSVHKAILAGRCAVLKAHFEHNTTECQTNIINCSLETEVLREVLNFIYSDRTDKLDEMPEKLLAAADYYQLTRLKSLCEEALHKKVTVENAIDILQLAELHSAHSLKQLILEFIRDGQAKLITKTVSWNTLKSVELIKAIYEFVMEGE